ncbi:carboxylating.nicotinate-nucleotide diphosphorylase [Methanoculleus sp. FWC-SCC1]|uniref:Nicotinate-nucleotide pyrophosphorylase [carboxylating] n=1 Tax=Methanoculleus frigidifontis TaxID=2584085 RepID=A0ABT8MCV5_9EURY|nr:carboxylating nicotinate-nucleotide diphosphorylase [Methanoculleus sp. FWC-SCC1]MDN7025761.1 carboxylating.nicotinate-nucleotide diphosphorylase [Methanoculleus sp. FWC-SCC1]
MIPLRYLLRFIEEDAPWGDATSDTVVPDVVCRAQILAKASGTVAGLSEARALFEHYGVTVMQRTADGRAVSAGTALCDLEGDARSILLVERTALNIIGRMSAIATKTRSCVEQARSVSPGTRIAATRKTAPGLRLLDKRAVQLGGGDPHRFTLSDAVLIKDNHLALVPIGEAVAKARAASLYRKVEVEVESADDAAIAAEAGADILLLDNMTPATVRETIDHLEKRGLRQGVVIEISGGVTGTTLLEYARTGADVISMGALTHTIENFDVSLEILRGLQTVRLA